MSFAILGMGTAVPTYRIEQSESYRVAEMLARPTAEQTTWLPAMYDNTGIDRRHMVLVGEIIQDILEKTNRSKSIFLPTGEPDDSGPTTAERMAYYVQHAGPLAVTAARKALDCSGMSAKDLTHLVTVSCTGFHAPGVDIELMQSLELPASIQRTHVGYMGCHGALNGLRVARAFAEADASALVLLCATELCSLHYFYGWDPQKMVANALFADGSASVVGAATPESRNAWRLTASGSHVFPGTANAMTWSIGDYGFEMTLSKKVPNLITDHLRPWMESWLRSHGLSIDDIGSWAIHPGGPKIISAVEDALGLFPGATAPSRHVLKNFGNMSSPTLLFIIDQLRRDDAPRPCVALGFGPGLTAEAALYQ